MQMKHFPVWRWALSQHNAPDILDWLNGPEASAQKCGTRQRPIEEQNKRGADVWAASHCTA